MGAKGQFVCRAAAVSLCLSAGIHAQTVTVPWNSYANGPQHNALSTIGSQRLEQIKWSTPIDLVLQNTSGPLYIHYGSPLVTAANTVLIPLRTTSSNTYQVEALSGANGSALYTLSTAYTPPPYTWIPVFGPTLSQGTRLYYPGPGGTVYSATKHAVRVISEGLRQEVKPYNIRTTIISPGAVATELPNTITDPDVAARVRKVYEMAIPADSFASMVVFSMSQPEDVDVNEILFRPTRQAL